MSKQKKSKLKIKKKTLARMVLAHKISENRGIKFQPDFVPDLFSEQKTIYRMSLREKEDDAFLAASIRRSIRQSAAARYLSEMPVPRRDNVARLADLSALTVPLRPPVKFNEGKASAFSSAVFFKVRGVFVFLIVAVSLFALIEIIGPAEKAFDKQQSAADTKKVIQGVTSCKEVLLVVYRDVSNNLMEGARQLEDSVMTSLEQTTPALVEARAAGILEPLKIIWRGRKGSNVE